jgi:hypothetical protein
MPRKLPAHPPATPADTPPQAVELLHNTPAQTVDGINNSTAPRARELRLGGAMPLQQRAAAQDTFLQSFALNGNVSAAAKRAGVHRDTIYNWRRDDAEFAARFASAEEDAIDILRAAAHQRGVSGWDVPMVSMGQVVMTTDKNGQLVPLMERKYSDTLLAKMLSARVPEYKPTTAIEVSGPGGGPIQQQVIFVLPQVVDAAPPMPFLETTLVEDGAEDEGGDE